MQWWMGLDSNQRRPHGAPDLQSAAMSLSATHPVSSGAPRRIRTRDPRIRNPVLSSTELAGQISWRKVWESNPRAACAAI